MNRDLYNAMNLAQWQSFLAEDRGEREHAEAKAAEAAVYLTWLEYEAGREESAK